MKKFGKKSKFYEVKNLKYVILNRLFIFFCKKSYKDFVSNIKTKSKIRETQVKILLEILKTNKNTEYLKTFETEKQMKSFVSSLLEKKDFTEEDIEAWNEEHEDDDSYINVHEFKYVA